MKKLALVLSLIALVFMPVVVNGQDTDKGQPAFVDGLQLASHCESDDWQQNGCMLYLAGVIDQVYNRQYDDPTYQPFCYDMSQADIAEVRTALLTMLQSVPEAGTAKYAASNVVIEAMRAAYPCKVA